jgi:hypothetical protein
VYLNAFASYGWLGGFSYFLLTLTTLFVGFRALTVRTPWQPYLLLALAAYVGSAFEGIVIDTDHWRHYYLLLGMIWGLAIATTRATARHRALSAARVQSQPAVDSASSPVFRLG